MDYPQDNTTTPNTAVAKLNGNDPDKRVGPSIILKVMAGDTIQAAVRAFYRQQATPQNNAGLPAEQMLAGLVQALAAPATQAAVMHDMRMAAPERVTSPGLTANDLQGLRRKDPNNIKDNKPKAYLNYVFFDNQLNFVQEGSGVKQVDGEAGQLETLASGEVVVKKSGFVYVYTSNESQQDVLFDNLSVYQSTGPILEETHYYPFGLVMDGISTSAPLKLANNYKYNGKELNHKEFSDGTGLEWYDYGFRNYDAQIGRFTEQDPLTDGLATVSPYQYALNDPISNIDKDGLMPTSLLCPGSSGFAVFVAKAGAAISNIARIASPAEKAVSISAHALQVAGTVGSVITFNDEINNFFTDRSVGTLVAESEINGLKANPEDGMHGTNGYIKGWENKSEADLKKKMIDLIMNTTWSNRYMRRVAIKMTDQFFNNTGGVFSSPELDKAVNNDFNFQGFANNIFAEFNEELKAVNGDISRIKKMNIDNPAFNRKANYTNGLGIIIHGVSFVQVHLVKFKFNPNTGNYYLLLRFDLYDNFGLDKEDISGSWWPWDYHNASGLKAWWLLQHKFNHVPLRTHVTTQFGAHLNINETYHIRR